MNRKANDPDGIEYQRVSINWELIFLKIDSTIRQNMDGCDERGVENSPPIK